jgi:transposase InsO family protein
MEHLAQGEDIQMRPSSMHLLALSEDRNVRVEVLDQGMTSYQLTEDMSEKISLLHYSALTGTIEDDMWIIDSGASRDMTGDQARLSNLNEKKTSYKVELGDKITYPVEGFGQASVKLKTSNNVHLSNVLYVPGLEKNLVSISCLEDKGNRIAFVDGKVLSWHKDSSIENARVIRSREGNLYRLLEQNEEALIHDEVNPNELWHRRYAHINYQALHFLRKMVEGIPELQSTHERICKGCALGKNIKKPFPSSNNRSKEILDLIHSDVWGPMPVKSLGGSLYYIIFIDDYSRKTWLYLLKTKDEVFSKFQEFKAGIENLTNKKIKTLRTDNGGECTSKEFVAFYKSAGIRRELIVPHNPQQNGVAERKNRSIEETVKALLNDQGLSMLLWGEAAMTTIYVQNRSPRRILKDMTPEESFSGKKPNVENLKILGCPVYSHIPKDKRNKLEPSGKKGIFVGYSDSSKAYRIYILKQHKIEASRDVTFNEKMAFKKSIEETIEEEENEEPTEESTENQDDEKEQPDHPMQPCETIDSDNIPKTRKRPTWLEATLQDAERLKVPEGTFRKSKKTKRYSSYAAYMTKLLDEEPTTFEEAVQKGQWKEAMTEEHQSIMKNDVWEIVPRPKEKSVVTSKWVYKIKHAADGSMDKYKARFVARGLSQKKEEDYDETFAPVARYTSIRAIISLVASMGWNLHHMDVKTAFLNGAIEEEVYIEQPQGFEVHSRDTHVCKLKKALYGLKQAPRAWYAIMDFYLTRLGFSKSHADPNLYYKVVDNAPVILLLYVDDLFITSEESLIIQCKKELAYEFDMKDLGLMHYYYYYDRSVVKYSLVKESTQ